MRIRKNAKLSSILPSHASAPETLHTHVCQLNQSPWDVIPLSHDTCPSLNYQFEGEDSFTGNGSLGDSMGAAESVASMMDGEERAVMFKVDEMVIDDNNETEMENYKTPCCIKTDGQGWRCRNEPKNGDTLCDHHLSLIKKPNKAAAAADLSHRGGRVRAAAKKGSSSSSNPYEFYYYSGFGPSWGKRRGEAKEAENSLQNDKTPSSYSQIDNVVDEFDFVDDDDDDDEDDDDDDDDDDNGDDSSGRRRIRKPVKARSLKSLM